MMELTVALTCREHGQIEVPPEACRVVMDVDSRRLWVECIDHVIDVDLSRERVFRVVESAGVTRLDATGRRWWRR